jgi:hypothetical protein
MKMNLLLKFIVPKYNTRKLAKSTPLFFKKLLRLVPTIYPKVSSTIAGTIHETVSRFFKNIEIWPGRIPRIID